MEILQHDISGAKWDQQALMQAVESAPSGLLILDAAGKIQSANRAVENLFGYTRQELAGCPVEVILPESDRARYLRQRDTADGSEIAKAVAGRDMYGVRKDGTEIPLQVYLNRMETDGSLILCTIIDIAERVRYQRQLEQAKQAAESANRAKSDFLARMSHEIRTPMNLIMGMNALLLESPLNEKQRQHVDISYRNIRRLLRVINGILDLSKVEAGKLTLEAAPFDLHEMLKECPATLSSAMEQKGLEFEMTIAPDVARYWTGDAERLQQVFLNLMGNSIKFTARGKIHLTVEAASGERGQPGLRCTVTDTGCGVPEDKRAMIFEAFQQAESSMARPYEGTGLGLAIARTLVEMMSGSIWMEPAPGPGSKFVFTVFFPLATQAAADGKAAAVSAAADRALEAGARILLVEDNPENMILLRAYLEKLPLALDFASNGAEAVAQRREGKYDLVLMDVQMPVMDGYTATREIRAWEKAKGLPPVPIVALTAHALDGAYANSLDAGCDSHLTKPVERKDLVEVIAKFAKRPPAAPKPSMSDSIAALRPAFLVKRGLDLVKMRDALAAGDFASIQAIGHNCKGTGAGYGFPDISTIGSSIEQAAKASSADQLEEALGRFEQCLAVA
jgi:PAS domain S-box-containing protein